MAKWRGIMAEISIASRQCQPSCAEHAAEGWVKFRLRGLRESGAMKHQRAEAEATSSMRHDENGGDGDRRAACGASRGAASIKIDGTLRLSVSMGEAYR